MSVIPLFVKFNFVNSNLENFVNTLIMGLLLQDTHGQELFKSFLDHFPSLEQRKFLNATLKLLSDKYLSTLDDIDATEESPVICAATGALRVVIGNDEARKSHLVTWLTSGSSAGIGEGCGIRRAAVAVFSEDKESMAAILEKSSAQFSDKLYIKHAPLLQQDGKAYRYTFIDNANRKIKHTPKYYCSVPGISTGWRQ